jgi:hypothetical protein
MYVPLAELPSAAAVPESATVCPFSFSWRLRMKPEMVPTIDVDVAHGLPLIASCPDIELPD